MKVTPTPEMHEYPPAPYFDIVLMRCPKAALLYRLLWKNKNEDFCIIIEKEKISSLYEEKKKFNHNLRLLHKEQLLNYFEDKHYINIELTGWSDELFE